MLADDASSQAEYPIAISASAFPNDRSDLQEATYRPSGFLIPEGLSLCSDSFLIGSHGSRQRKIRIFGILIGLPTTIL